MTNPNQSPSVLSILEAANNVALTRQKAVMDQWRILSFRLGSQLPDSLLLVSIQRCGRLDALVRCVEEEFANFVSNPDQAPITAGDTLHTLSETWIGSIYAILFVLSRRIKLKIEGLDELHEHSRLIRVALEKHEIPSDKDLKQPLELQTVSTAPGEPRTLTYDRRDPLRSHIMPSGINPQGSICWFVTDIKNKNERWLSRRYISDCALALVKP